MTNIFKFKENNNSSIYIIEKKIKGIFIVPKNLNNNIKLYLSFKNENDINLDEDIITNLENINNCVNSNNEEAFNIIAFIKSENNYDILINDIKELVNCIYNKLLENKNKNNFIKKVELIDYNDNFNPLINFLCQKEPKKFEKVSLLDLINKSNSINNITKNRQEISNNIKIMEPPKYINNSGNIKIATILTLITCLIVGLTISITLLK